MSTIELEEIVRQQELMIAELQMELNEYICKFEFLENELKDMEFDKVLMARINEQ